MSRDAAAPVRTVAIAGGTGSGKTTLAMALAQRLGGRCAILDHDSYYRDWSHLTPEARAEVNFDHPESLENDLLVEHVARLRRGEPVDKPDYCFATHRRLPSSRWIEPRPVVIVEGILVLSLPLLRAAFDLRVFVDTCDDVRALRRVRRDLRERGRTVDGVFAQWMTTVRPMHAKFVAPARECADLVVSGETPIEEAVERVLARLPLRASVDARTVEA